MSTLGEMFLFFVLLSKGGEPRSGGGFLQHYFNHNSIILSFILLSKSNSTASK